MKNLSNNHDPIINELLQCKGNAACIVAKLDQLHLYNCDFTLQEFGHIMHLTRERVRQIEDSALRKLRHPRYAKALMVYLHG